MLNKINAAIRAYASATSTKIVLPAPQYDDWAKKGYEMGAFIREAV